MSRTRNQPATGVDDALEQLARLVLVASSVADLLQRAVRILGSSMPVGTETSVALEDDGTALCAWTAERVRALDEAQFGTGRGPGVHALRAGAVTEVVDARVDVRWPEHAARAAEAGMLGSLSFPLLIDDRTGGALTVWAPDAEAFDPTTRAILQRLVPHVRAAVAGLQDRARARAMADDLDVELETRAVIGRAKGILVERYQLTPERAVELLVRMSARSQVAVREIAAGLVRTERRA